jgi:hypothetical protein
VNLRASAKPDPSANTLPPIPTRPLPWQDEVARRKGGKGHAWRSAVSRIAWNVSPDPPRGDRGNLTGARLPGRPENEGLDRLPLLLAGLVGRYPRMPTERLA